MKLETVLRELVAFRKSVLDARVAMRAALPDNHVDKYVDVHVNAHILELSPSVSPEYQRACALLVVAGVLEDAGLDQIGNRITYRVVMRRDLGICIDVKADDASQRESLIWACAATKRRGPGDALDREYGEAKLAQLQAELDQFDESVDLGDSGESPLAGNPTLDLVTRLAPKTHDLIMQVPAVWAALESGKISYDLIAPVIEADEPWQRRIKSAVDAGHGPIRVTELARALRDYSLAARSLHVEFDVPRSCGYDLGILKHFASEHAAHPLLRDLGFVDKGEHYHVTCTLRPDVSAWRCPLHAQP